VGFFFFFFASLPEGGKWRVASGGRDKLQKNMKWQEKAKWNGSSSWFVCRQSGIFPAHQYSPHLHSTTLTHWQPFCGNGSCVSIVLLMKLTTTTKPKTATTVGCGGK